MPGPTLGIFNCETRRSSLKSEGKEDKAEQTNTSDDVLSTKLYLPTLPLLTSYGNEPVEQFIAELNGRKLPYHALSVYNF